MAAIENDVTAEWIPFVLPNEWLDRQFLLPRDWLLAMQSMFVVFLLGRVAVDAWQSSGASGAWETYSAVFFMFLGSSARRRCLSTPFSVLCTASACLRGLLLPKGHPPSGLNCVSFDVGWRQEPKTFTVISSSCLAFC